jgi:hypothetical protein
MRRGAEEIKRKVRYINALVKWVHKNADPDLRNYLWKFSYEGAPIQVEIDEGCDLGALIECVLDAQKEVKP